MTSEEFFAFCQKRSNSFGQANKEVAILAVWAFLGPDQEQLPTPEEIAAFLDRQISEASRPALVEAYAWLKEVLASAE